LGNLKGFLLVVVFPKMLNGEMRVRVRPPPLDSAAVFWIEFLDDVDAMWVSAGSCALTHSPNQKPTISGLPYMESAVFPC
jgi:hypothetical protein